MLRYVPPPVNDSGLCLPWNETEKRVWIFHISVTVKQMIYAFFSDIPVLRVAIVSNIYGHGTILSDIGTSLVIGAGVTGEIKGVDVYTQVVSDAVSISFQEKVHIFGILDTNLVRTYLSLIYKLLKNKYDKIFFNSMPTSQGSKTVTNFVYLLAPTIINLLSNANVIVLYHNTPFVSNYRSLGYHGFLNKFKASAVKVVESMMFLNCKVFFLLDLYAKIIKQKIPKARVFSTRIKGINSIPSLFLNNSLFLKDLNIKRDNVVPVILLYGSWGPQKDLLSALQAVKYLHNTDFKFKLLLAGSNNEHFTEYNHRLQEILETYGEYIDHNMGYVDESDLMKLFLSSDIIILPYRESGGYSGVLSNAMLFNLHIIIPKFPEYLEQSGDYHLIKFVSRDFSSEDIYAELTLILSNFTRVENISIETKALINELTNSIKNMLA